MHIESDDWSASARRLKTEVLARATWSATWNVDFHNYSKFTNVPEHSITFWIYLFFIVPLVSTICISPLHWLVYFSFHSETECFFLVGEHVTLFLTPLFRFFFCMSLVNLSNHFAYSIPLCSIVDISFPFLSVLSTCLIHLAWLNSHSSLACLA